MCLEITIISESRISDQLLDCLRKGGQSGGNALSPLLTMQEGQHKYALLRDYFNSTVLRVKVR
jgi:hypothetical protein